MRIAQVTTDNSIVATIIRVDLRQTDWPEPAVGTFGPALKLFQCTVDVKQGSLLGWRMARIAMANSQNFLDNLKNLEVVVSVALEHTRKNLDEFMKNATAYQVRQAERSVAKIRTLAAQLEKEFSALEYLAAKARSSPGKDVQ